MAEFIEDLEITALTHGGRGIGHFDGKAVFVPLTAPGDRVACKIIKAKKRFAEAELVDIVKPSSLRATPPCPYYGVCGGCQWQHLPYHEQLGWKEQIFADHLIRNDIAAADVLQPIVPSTDEWRYRNRVQLKCHWTGNAMAIGFFRPGSHFVVDIADCLLLNPSIHSFYQCLHSELATAPAPDCIPQVDLAAGDDGTMRMVLHVLPKARGPIRSWLEAFAGRHHVNVFLQSGRKDTLERVHGDEALEIKIDEPKIQLHYGPGGFAQINSSQNRRMISEMVDLLALSGQEQVLDLFCGMGNFSLPLARRARRVVGVEDHEASIEYARHNASMNKIANVEFHAEDAALTMKRLGAEGFDLVVLDPPRTGSYQVARELLNIMPQRVLYVSCDPATLSRDLKPLVHGGYRVLASRAFDLFPQTWHIESMTLLQRQDSEHG